MIVTTVYGALIIKALYSWKMVNL